MDKCKCGCGKLVKHIWALGHNWKERTHTEKSKEKMCSSHENRISWTKEELDYIKIHINKMSNKELALSLNKEEKQIKYVINGHKIKRELEFTKQLRVISRSANLNQKERNQKEENNPNWKGGLSNNKIRWKLEIEKYPKEVECRKILNKAVKNGEIVRGNCIVCGNSKSHGHHLNYDEPLNIIWLCIRHHKKIHFLIKSEFPEWFLNK